MRSAAGLTAIATFVVATAVPVLIAGLLLFVLRARRGDPGRAARETGLDVAMALWVIAILAFTVVPLQASGNRPPIGLIPFADALERITSGTGSIPEEVADWLINLVLFLPLGILAGVRWGRGWWLVFVLLAVCLSTAIELTQALQDAGRFASTTDVVTNTAGAALGFAIGLRIRRRGAGTPGSDPIDTERFVTHDPAAGEGGPDTSQLSDRT